MENISRRKVGTALAGAVVGGAVLASCTQTQWDQVEAQFADVITQVQQGVKNACAQVNVLVPTANSVLNVLLAILGSTSVVGVTASVVQQAINAITGDVCSPTPTAKLGTPHASGGTKWEKVIINGKPVDVVCY